MDITAHNLELLSSCTKNLKVLFVEDSFDSRTQAIKILENYFSKIDVAVDGMDGLEKFKNQLNETGSYYDLLIIDIVMPKMDGIDLSKAIYELNPKQKIIVLSAHSKPKYFIDLLSIGIEGFIQKPISFENTYNLLQKICTNLKNDNIIKLANNCDFNKETQELYCDNQKIDLTRNEYKLIALLCNTNCENDSFTIEDISTYLYFNEPLKTITENSIRAIIKRIRKKIPYDLIIADRRNGYKIKRMDF